MAAPAASVGAVDDFLASVAILNATSTQVLSSVLADLVGDQLTLAQLRLLRLVERQGILRVGDVAAFMRVSNAAASKAVDRLVRVGLLRRTEAKGDRRTLEISVTQEGHSLLKAFEVRSGAILATRLASVDVRGLHSMSDRLDRLSVSLAAGREATGGCFRCGLFLREECLLRTVGERDCYLQLGPARRDKGGGRAPDRVKSKAVS